MRLLVTGATGMVGRAVSEFCRVQGDTVITRDHRGLDIANADAVLQTLLEGKPDVVINCAAWTDVDGCESNSHGALAANAVGPENLARASRQTGAGFVTISTDYVFDGKKQGFYTQRDDPNPLSVYARSKLEGERRAQAGCARTIVVRTGFIFGPGGRNFLSTVLERSRGGQCITAIGDAQGSPTYSLDLAVRLRELAMLDLPGIYHVINGGAGASYVDFTRTILEYAGMKTTVKEVTSDSIKRPAERPKNSRLRCLLSEPLGLVPLRLWQDAARDYADSQKHP